MGAVVGERFEIHEVLGRGGFAFAYLAEDRLRGDLAVLKELAPPGSVRLQDGNLSLDAIGKESAQRLRQQFISEAKLLSRLHIRGVLAARAAISERGTAFYATDAVKDVRTLRDLIDSEGRLPWRDAVSILEQLVEILDHVHKRGILHRDIKPQNVLVGPNGDAYLIDFGAAREWVADASKTQTVLFSPAYAPLEQLSERARRGPATDIYSLSATAYHMITGKIPPSPAERLDGAPLIPVREIVPNAEVDVSRAIEAGLELTYGERPQSIDVFRKILEAEYDEARDLSLKEYDQKLVELMRLTFDRRQCPACDAGVLEQPAPLRKGVCPVCWQGRIQPRNIHERLCPVCKISTLREVQNDRPLSTCPLCRTGWMERKRKKIFGREFDLHCSACEGRFEVAGDELTLLSVGTSKASVPLLTKMTAEEWRARDERSTLLRVCDGCDAQFDHLSDGRWRQTYPTKGGKHLALYAEEWARVAAGFEPGTGNAECSECEADYFLEGDQATLLHYHEDPNGFADENLGRLMTLDELRWAGIGKESPNPGFVCNQCHTEFDKDDGYLQLIRTANRNLVRHLGATHKLEDWHRLSRQLPTDADEEAFKGELRNLLLQAYLQGELKFDERDGMIWNGPATRQDTDQRATLQVNATEVVHGSLMKKWRIPREDVLAASAEQATLTLTVSGEPGTVEFQIEPVTLVAQLDSGEHEVTLHAEHLAQRLKGPASN